MSLPATTARTVETTVPHDLRRSMAITSKTARSLAAVFLVSGALIGIAIGHAVSKNHEMKIFGMRVVPFTDPARGGVGLALTKRW